MKLCATCQNKYPDDANFCPRESCAGADGPHRLDPIEPAARFVPVSRLGGGASGEVWQASDSQSGGAVAYKLVATEALPTPVAVDRALREIRQLQRASSPRIVKVIDFGKTPEGQVFVASELAEGEPLDRLVERLGPFSLERAKNVIAQVGEALLDAQKVGVVHRDLSAKNILVSGDSDVKVINFAVARPVSATIFGVPAFMAPEQAEGKLIDQRSNTYGVAALLYFMLTGQGPAAGETPEATLEAVLKGDVMPPSIKRGSGLTAEVDRVVLKALERNSSRRPLTMRQFLADVAALIVTDRQTVAPTSTASGREPAFAKTMMFAGGSQEVHKLVAQAVAARQAATVPSPEPSAPEPAREAPPAIAADSGPSVAFQNDASGPSPTGARLSAGRPSHGAAVGATMMAMPAAGLPAGAPKGSSAHTPPIAPVGQGEAGAGANFRETLWFKKGDVDQMVADARAKVAAIAEARKVEAAAEAPASGPALTDEAKPLEDRYVDDGTVTSDDRKNFSLDQSGGTSAKSGRGRKQTPIPGDRMSETEVMEEIGGGKRLMIILIVVAVALALGAVVVVFVRGKGKGMSAPLPVTPAAAPAPDKTTQPAPEALKPEPTPAPDKAGSGAATKPVGKADGADEASAPRPAAKPVSAKKKATAKKKAAPAVKKGHR